MLAQKIRSAREVTFVGIVPRPLLEALTAASQEDDGANLPPFRYLTPLPEAILNGSEQRAQTRVAHRWQTGFMGLRNLVQARAPEDADVGQDLIGSLSSLPSVFLDCIIIIYGQAPNGRPALFYFTELPITPTHAPRILRLTPTNTTTAEIVRYLEQIAASAPPLHLREVLCHRHYRAGQFGVSEAPSFMISRLRSYGAKPMQPGVLKPVCVVVVRAESAKGRHVILKQRTPLTDSDDFGKLSLPSSRVQEADLAEAYQTRLPVDADDNKALDQIWKAAGCPKPLFLPMEAFQLAAIREMFVTCGLEVDGDRLKLIGTYVVDHEARPGEQLGFVVYALDLQRESSFDEMEFALSRPPHALRAVPVDGLYTSGLDLNRLLRTGRDWLMANAIDEPTVPPEAG